MRKDFIYNISFEKHIEVLTNVISYLECCSLINPLNVVYPKTGDIWISYQPTRKEIDILVTA